LSDLSAVLEQKEGRVADLRRALFPETYLVRIRLKPFH